MAKIKLGALVVGIRGTVGGVTYSQSKAGPYAKIWARGANPRTVAQSKQRGRISNQPAFWKALTPTQRTAWNTYAALPAQERTNVFGDPYYLSGFQWFTIINVRLSRAGYAHRTTPPTDTVPGAPVLTGFNFEAVAGNPLVEITYSSAQFPAGMDIVIEAAVVVSGGHTTQQRGFKLLVSGFAAGTSSYDFTSEFVAAFGTPAVGWQAFLRVYRQTDEGPRSTETTMMESYT